jgi:hypothetical protein
VIAECVSALNAWLPSVVVFLAESCLIAPGRDNNRLTFAADSKPLRRCSPVSVVSMTGTCVNRFLANIFDTATTVAISICLISATRQSAIACMMSRTSTSRWYCAGLHVLHRLLAGDIVGRNQSDNDELPLIDRECATNARVSHVLESLIDHSGVRDGNGRSLAKVGHHC